MCCHLGFYGAGGGNRTRDQSLGRIFVTTTTHPRTSHSMLPAYRAAWSSRTASRSFDGGNSRIALVDLGDHDGPWPILSEASDSIDFGRELSVVELEQQWIRLAAVNARVLEQIRQDHRFVLLVPAPAALVRPLQVFGPVALVMLTAVRSGTCQAFRSTLAQRTILEGEHRERLHESALSALLQACSDSCGEFEQPDTPFGRSLRGRSQRLGPSGFPIELDRRSTSMTVRAAHIAFRDLREHADPSFVCRARTTTLCLLFDGSRW